MNAILSAIQAQLKNVITCLNDHVPSDEPFGIAHNNWSFPGLNRSELIESAQRIIELIEDRGTDEEVTEPVATRLSDYIRRLKHLQSSTIPSLWGNAGQAVPAYMLTIDGLRNAIAPALSPDAYSEASSSLKRLNSRRRAIEARINELRWSGSGV